VAVLSIAEKLDSVMKMKIADLSEINYLVTDLDPNDAKLGPYQNKGATLL
jgi:DeoR/GlpR family transcriptional regulator of sugar metabolism